MDKARYLAAEASMRDSQEKSNAARVKMTQLLSQVDGDMLRQELMQTFHEYAAHMAIRAKCNEIMRRDGHA